MTVMDARCSACHEAFAAGGLVFRAAGVLCRACDVAPPLRKTA